MMYFNNDEERAQYISTEIKALRDAAACLPVLREVLKTFDGKVYNCRFEKALQAAAPADGPRMYCRTGYNNQVIIYIYNKGYEITVAQLSRDDMKDGKRINAEKLIESARKNRESHLKEAYKIETAAATAQQTAAMIDGLKAQIQSILRTIPSEVRDAYNLNGKIGWY